MSPARIRVLQCITRMMVGGAQLTLFYNVTRGNTTRFRYEVATGPQTGPEGNLLDETCRLVPTTVIPNLVREIRPWREAAAYRELRTLLHDPPQPELGPYTIIHTHVSKAGILARRAARGARTPIVVHTAHGWQWTHPTRGALNQLMVRSERWAAQFTDRIIVVSEGDREKGLAAGVGRPEQYVLIESAIPMEAFDPATVSGISVRTERGIPLDAPVAGTVGRFAYPKEPRLMLDVAHRVLEANPRAHFIYVGDGPERDAVLGEYAEVVDHPRLHLLGLRDDVPAVIAAMDVFVLSSSLEGMPRAVIEAQAMGKPVVSTPAGGVPEVVLPGKTGVIAPFADAEALSQGILGLFNDPARAREFGAAGSALVRERFDVRRMITRIEAVYEELLASRAKR